MELFQIFVCMFDNSIRVGLGGFMQYTGHDLKWIYYYKVFMPVYYQFKRRNILCFCILKNIKIVFVIFREKKILNSFVFRHIYMPLSFGRICSIRNTV